jgi:hypothetical protein
LPMFLQWLQASFFIWFFKWLQVSNVISSSV